MSKIIRVLTWTGIAAVVAVLFLYTFKAGERRGQNAATGRIIRDTVQIVRIDTITAIQPKPVAVVTVDTMLVPVYVHTRDTVFVPMPREQAYYKDSLYEAWVSGYRPELDSIRVFRRLERMTIHTVSEVKIRSRWGVGVQAGYGISKDGIWPYVGIGVNYSLFSW